MITDKTKKQDIKHTQKYKSVVSNRQKTKDRRAKENTKKQVITKKT